MSVTEAVSSRVPASLATPTDLEAEGRDRVVQLLNVLLSDAFALYVKTKNYHWHMVGSHYREYHLLLDEQADQIFAATDIFSRTCPNDRRNDDSLHRAYRTPADDSR